MFKKLQLISLQEKLTNLSKSQEDLKVKQTEKGVMAVMLEYARIAVENKLLPKQKKSTHNVLNAKKHFV